MRYLLYILMLPRVRSSPEQMQGHNQLGQIQCFRYFPAPSNLRRAVVKGTSNAWSACPSNTNIFESENECDIPSAVLVVSGVLTIITSASASKSVETGLQGRNPHRAVLLSLLDKRDSVIQLNTFNLLCGDYPSCSPQPRHGGGGRHSCSWLLSLRLAL